MLLFAEHHGNLDFLLRFAQIEHVAVDHADADFIQFAVGKLGGGLAVLGRDRPQFRQRR